MAWRTCPILVCAEIGVLVFPLLIRATDERRAYRSLQGLGLLATVEVAQAHIVPKPMQTQHVQESVVHAQKFSCKGSAFMLLGQMHVEIHKPELSFREVSMVLFARVAITLQLQGVDSVKNGQKPRIVSIPRLDLRIFVYPASWSSLDEMLWNYKSPCFPCLLPLSRH